MTPPLAALEGIGVRLGDIQILRRVDLRVEAGEAVGLFGANGSGKTTLLRVLATLLPPTQGSGLILGADLSTEGLTEVRPRIGLIGHLPATYPELTLQENMELVARLAGLDRDQALEALEVVGLGAARRRRGSQCSNGMLRRAEFARMLLVEPDLLLLDEAHVGLDRAAVELVGLLVKEVINRGGSAVLASHESERASAIVGRWVELIDGTLTELRDVP
ncbi:MAG: ATP-binding cassette domain-containing protein [Acidimicrobiia bacterium]